MNAREWLGTRVGSATAPLFSVVAAARHARVFHPDGMVFAGAVETEARVDEARVVANRLTGAAIVRFSTALWRGGREWPDALGCAIRFRSVAEPSTTPAPGDQDLLFATIRSPLTLPFAPITTNVHDYLENVYFATAPFHVDGVGRVKWRLVPERHPDVTATTRAARILEATDHHQAVLHLELRRTFHREWHRVARLRLDRPVRVDQDALRFSPFRTGRGIYPRGFVHALRHSAYGASQAFGHRSSRGRANGNARMVSTWTHVAR